MEELLLGAVLPGDELDVVHQQHVDGAVLLPEGGKAVEADGVDHLVDEAVGGDVEQVQALLTGLDVVTDGVHEVGLAQADSAVDEERVVGLAGDLRHRPRGGVGKLVGRAHHEAVEGVLRIQGGGVALGSRSRPLGGRCGVWGLLEDHVHVGATELLKGLREHALVVLGQPLAELGVGHSDQEARPVEGEVARGAEPGGKAVAVHLALDLGENLVPEVHEASPESPGRGMA